jgi:hypothetical protein
VGTFLGIQATRSHRSVQQAAAASHCRVNRLDAGRVE